MKTNFSFIGYLERPNKRAKRCIYKIKDEKTSTQRPRQVDDCRSSLFSS